MSVAVGVCLLATATGVLAGRAGSDDTPNSVRVRLHAARLSIDYQAPWSRTRPRPVPGLDLDHPVALRSIDDGLELVVGTERVSDPRLLPAALERRVEVPRAVDRVRLGSARGLRYRRLTPKEAGARFSLVVVPTRSTAVYLVCRRPEQSIDASDQAACDAIGRTLKLKEAARALAPTEGYARGLRKALATLRSVRRAGLDRLSAAPSVSQQASVLDDLRRDCRVQARAVRRLAAGPQEQVPQAQLADAVDRLCDDFAAMASAAASYDRSRYAEAAKHSTAAARSVVSSVRAFSAAGYRLS